MRLSKAVIKVFACLIISMWISQGTVIAEESPVASPQMSMMMGHGETWNGESNPGVAALLSLQPMPVDFGNFYVNNWKKGILYTTLELGLFIPGMALLSDNHMGFSSGGDRRTSWTDSERVTFYSLLAAYIAVKVVSAFDAGSTAERIAKKNMVSANLDTRERRAIMSAHVSF